MKRYVFAFITLLISFNAFSAKIEATHIQVCFTPGSNCTQDIVDAIAHAHKSIFVQAYSFTSAPIAQALVKAKEQGITVEVILDKSQNKSEKYSSSTYLSNQHIPVWIDNKVAIAHNKVMIIDQQTVITGSFNFTKAAQQRNAENLLIIQSPELASLYLQNWQRRMIASTPLSQYAVNNAKNRKYNEHHNSLFSIN